MLLMITEDNVIFLRLQQSITKVRGVIRKGGKGIVIAPSAVAANPRQSNTSEMNWI